MPGTPAAAAYPWRSCQITFSLRPTPYALPARFTGRNTYPSVTPAAEVHAFAQVLLRSCGAMPGTPAAAASPWRSCQTAFSLRPTPYALPARFTGRNTYPSVTPADTCSDP